jgi:membrane protein
MDFISVRLPHFPDRTGSLLATIIDFRVLISLAGLFLFFLFMYTVLPNKKLDVLYQIPGAVLGALGWWGFTDLFSKFTDLFDIFSMYGSLATVVASMLWMYCCMYIMFICAEINSHFAQMIISYIKGRKARRTAAAKENSD